jgi:hypothetical protein
MKFEEIIGKMSEEAKQRLSSCKTQEEVQEVLSEELGTPLDDELLDAIAGGWDVHMFDDSSHVWPQGKPSVIC